MLAFHRTTRAWLLSALASGATLAIAVAPASCGARTELLEIEQETEPFCIECILGLADCQGDVEGCETDLRRDEASCGACDVVCEEGTTCRAGICARPMQIVDVTAAYNTTCALRGDGRVLCWGRGREGQLGDGRAVDSSAPVFVEGVEDAFWLRTNQARGCALARDRTMRCWGQARAESWLGDGTEEDSPTSYEVDVPADTVDTDAGQCVLRSNREVWCSGANGAGSLGDGTTTTRREPAPVVGLRDVVEVDHLCALRCDGQVWCWGFNDGGRMWDAEPQEVVTVPRPITGLPPVRSFDVSFAGGCGIMDRGVDASGRVRPHPPVCWGSVSSNRDQSPAAVSGAFDTATVQGEIGTFCSLTTGGRVRCWRGHQTEQPAVPDLPDGTDLAVSSQHFCLLASSGEVLCWGNNSIGQLGDGTLVDRDTAAPVLGLEREAP